MVVNGGGALVVGKAVTIGAAVDGHGDNEAQPQDDPFCVLLHENL